jgi:hypothetical protein
MAYDSVRKVTVLFGGHDGAYDGETWEWDGDFWTLRASTGPTPRGEHTLGYDSARGVTVLFGGADTGEYYGETWEWDGDVWVLRETPGPSPRVGHGMIYDSFRAGTVLFGGYDGSYFGGTWAYDAVVVACQRDPVWVCDGDVDGNGAVNPVDVGLVQAAFCAPEQCTPEDLCQYDIDCNGAINPVDAGLVQSLFGLCNAPRGVCP